MKKLLAVVVSLMVLGQLYYGYSGDFRLNNVMVASDINDEKQESLEALEQPYTFLGHGRQTYAFLSHDRRYVLKLFKGSFVFREALSYLIAPVGPLRALFLHHGQSHTHRVKRLMTGYLLASGEYKEKSALVYFHPSKSVGLKKVEITTPLGFKQAIDLNDYVFVIQEYVRPTSVVIEDLIGKGEIEAVKENFSKLANLYKEGYQAALLDHDYNILENTGFLRGEAVRHDVGRVVYDEKMTTEEHAKKDFKIVVNKRLKPWLKKHCDAKTYQVITSHLDGLVSTFSVDHGRDRLGDQLHVE